MQLLIHQLQKRGRGVVYLPEWSYVQQAMFVNQNAIVDYYRPSGMAVDSDHPLVTLLLSLGIDVTVPLLRFHSYMSSNALTISMGQAMTSSLSRGRPFKNVFYRQPTLEFLLAHDNDFDPVIADRNWQDLIPIRVLSHGRSAINHPLLTGKTSGGDVAVIAINIPLLALQYRAFRLEQIQLENEKQVQQKTIMQFLFAYPLLNAIMSHDDYALVNRMRMLSGLDGHDRNDFKHPFHVTNYDQRIDRLYGKLLEHILASRMNISTIAQTIPMFYDDDLLSLSMLPDIAPTRQVNWCALASRIELIQLLLKVQSSDGKATDGNFVSQLRYRLGTHLRDSSLRDQLPPAAFQRIQSIIQELLF